MDKITTSCRTRNTRFTRLNLLGWALLCPYAVELLWHGSTPLVGPDYPTANESKSLHQRIKDFIDNAVKSIGVRIVTGFSEYEQELGIRRGDVWLCARSRADLVYILRAPPSLMSLYIEVSSTRINIAKPWQALLRGIALYYEWRLPTGIIIVSPEKIMYKLLENNDQIKTLNRIRRTDDDFQPSPNLCSLCELAQYCPFKVV